MKLIAAIASCVVGVNAISNIIPSEIVNAKAEQVLLNDKAGEEASSYAWTIGTVGAANVCTGCVPPLVKHLGGIMTGTIPIYVAYYGNNFATGGSQASYVTLTNNVLTSISSGTSQWYNTAKTYATTLGTPSFSSANYKILTGYAQGKSLTIAGLQSVLAAAAFPNSASALYVVITDSTVAQADGTSSYGVNYCGWHSYYNSRLVQRKYAFVGTGHTNCAWPIYSTATPGQTLASPNGGALDATISVLLHEITEAVTDPLLNAWYDSAGNENGDECNFFWGQALDDPANPGKIYNFVAGTSKYLVQQSYDQTSNSCRQITYTS